MLTVVCLNISYYGVFSKFLNFLGMLTRVQTRLSQYILHGNKHSTYQNLSYAILFKCNKVCLAVIALVFLSHLKRRAF